MRKYTEWSDITVNNLKYERPATPMEQTRQASRTLKLNYPRVPKGDAPPNYKTLVDTRTNGRNKYWRAKCIECGNTHIVRSDKIKNKRCKHGGNKHGGNKHK